MKAIFNFCWLRQLGVLLIITEICFGFQKHVLNNLLAAKSSSQSYFNWKKECKLPICYQQQQRLFSTQSSSSIKTTNNTHDFYKSTIQGADNVIVIQDEQTKQNKYIPKAWSNINKLNSNSDIILESASPEEMWQWLQEKKILEKELKSAIASNITDIEIQEDYFSKYEPYLALEHSDILQKNLQFFQALNKGDTNSLRSLWFDSNDAICIQSGTNAIITGYRNIINWLTHTSNELPRLHHQAKNITLNYFGDVAIVTCTVDISTNKNENNNGVISKKRNNGGNNNKKGRTSVNQPYFCTNIFVKPADTDTYLLSAHIASPKFTFDSKEANKARSTTYQDPSARLKKKDGSGGGNIMADGSRLMSIQQMFNAQNKNINIFEAAIEEEDEEEEDDDDDDDDEEEEDDEDDEEEDDIVSSNADDDDDDDDDDESSDGEDGDNNDDEDETPSKKKNNNNNNSNNNNGNKKGLTPKRAQALRTALTKALIKLGLAPPSSLNNGQNNLPKNVMIIDAVKLGKLNGVTGSGSSGSGNSGGMKSAFGEKVLKAIQENMKKNGIRGGIVDITEEVDNDEDDDDEDDDDDDDGKKKKTKIDGKNKKSKSSNSNAGVLGNGKGFGKVNDITVKRGSGTNGVSKKSSSKYLIQDYGNDDDDDDDDDDYDDDDDDDDDEDDYTSDATNEEAANKIAKNLAYNTLKAIKYLHSTNRLTATEKSLLISDVINKNAISEFSKVEIAFSVCIGPGRPEELLSAVSLSINDFSQEPVKAVRNFLYQKHWAAQKQSSGLSSVEADQIDEEVMNEFEDMCHALALSLDTA